MKFKAAARRHEGGRFVVGREPEDQYLNFKANCICLDDPESPVGKRVLEITPNVELPTCATRPG